MQGGDDEDDNLEGEYDNTCVLLQNEMQGFSTENEYEVNEHWRYCI
jgi:hypothetical protein